MWHSLKNIYKNGGFQRADTWNLVSGNHLRSRKNGSASASKFRKGDATALDELVFHNILMPNPFFLKTVDNFTKKDKEIFQLYLTCFRACLLGGGGPQVGEVTRQPVVEE